MAPELWQGQAASVQSDIYAMGVLLYFLVTGEYPVRMGGLTVQQAIEAIAKRRPLLDLRSDLPEPFLRTVSTAMETDPAKRFASAGQLAAALAECLGTAAPVETTVPVAEPRRSWKRRVISAGIALALIGGKALYNTPAMKRLLHLDHSPAAAAGIPVSKYDQYLHAQELLQKSYKDSNVTEAVKEFQQLLTQDPDFALAQAGLGAAYFKQYRNSSDGKLLDKAKDATNKALAMDSNLAPAYVTLAQIEADAGATHAVVALQLANKAIGLDKTSADAYAAQGEAFEALGKMPDAITAIQHAIDLDPDNSMWLLRLGDYYKSSGRLQAAADTWQKAVDVDPQNTFAYYDLGLADRLLDKLSAARKDFQKALSIGPDADTYRALGTVYQLEGNYDDAIQMDKKSLDLDPLNHRAWGNLGSAYSWKGGAHQDATKAYGRAIELAEQQLAKSPEDPDLLIDLANYYASIGNAQKSLPLVRKALALSSDDSAVNFIAGYSYELLGQREKAIPLIAKALAQGGPSNELQRSPELASLRIDPAFTAALEKAKAAAAVDNTKKLN
jgi:serine/threonine-protein kinase